MKDVAKFTGMLSIAAAVKAGFEGKQSLFKGKRDEAGLSAILCAGHRRTVLVACGCLGDTWALAGLSRDHSSFIVPAAPARRDGNELGRLC